MSGGGGDGSEREEEGRRKKKSKLNGSGGGKKKDWGLSTIAHVWRERRPAVASPPPPSPNPMLLLLPLPFSPLSIYPAFLSSPLSSPFFVVSCPFPPSPLQSFLSPPTSPFVYFWGIGVCVLCCMFKDSPFPHLFPLRGANHKTVVATFVQRFLLPPPLPPPPIHSEAFIPFLPLFSREMCVQCVYPISGLGQVEHNIMGGFLLPLLFPLFSHFTKSLSG